MSEQYPVCAGEGKSDIEIQLLAMREHINTQGAMLRQLAAHIGLRLETRDMGDGKVGMRWVEASEKRIVTL